MLSNSALTVGIHVPVKNVFAFYHCGSAAATKVKTGSTF